MAQIHELSTFSGTPTSTDYLVIDDGTTTQRLSGSSYITAKEAEAELDTTAASGTTDGDLYAAIVALGWEGEVITG